MQLQLVSPPWGMDTLTEGTRKELMAIGIRSEAELDAISEEQIQTLKKKAQQDVRDYLAIHR